MDRPRAADDFATIRARMDELSRERGRAKLSNEDVRRDASMPRGGSIRRPHQRSARGRDRCADLVKGVARPSPEVADFARQGLGVGRVVPSAWILRCGPGRAAAIPAAMTTPSARLRGQN
jgi:hypothetical protein